MGKNFLAICKRFICLVSLISYDNLSVEGNGKEAEVEFDETNRTPEAGMFKVDGYEVTKAELKADRRTVKLTLDKELKDARTVSVSVDGERYSRKYFKSKRAE